VTSEEQHRPQLETEASILFRPRFFNLVRWAVVSTGAAGVGLIIRGGIDLDTRIPAYGLAFVGGASWLLGLILPAPPPSTGRDGDDRERNEFGVIHWLRSYLILAGIAALVGSVWFLRDGIHDAKAERAFWDEHRNALPPEPRNAPKHDPPNPWGLDGGLEGGASTGRAP
jgi:hypothetical protein